MFSSLKSISLLGGRKKMAQTAAHDEVLRDNFDAAFYRLQKGTLATGNEEELFKHFVTVGWQAGLDPNAEFSASLYLKHNSDVAEASLNPFVHYLMTGKSEGRQPMLSLWGKPDGATVAAAHLDAVIGEADLEFLRLQLPKEVAALSDRAVVAYFLVHGQDEKLQPTPDFSIETYLALNTDVAAGGQNAFLHYVLRGREEGRMTHEVEYDEIPEDQAKESDLEADMADAAPYFDEDYYRARYPDMADATHTLMHYMLYGWREGRDPSEAFSTKGYLEENPDVAEADLNPLLHYARSGKNEGRTVPAAPSLESPRTPPPSEQEVNAGDIDAVRDDFDAEYYRAMNDDLEGDDEVLLKHFMQKGWREQRDPCREFSVSYYLETYPDIAGSGINPFLHYCLFGRTEGRRPRGDEPMEMIFNPKAEIIPQHLSSVMRYPEKGKRKPRPPKSVNPESLDLHWVMPDFARGSGGHMTILRMVRHLEYMGHRCHIWIESPVFHESGEEAWENIVKYFQCVEAPVDFVENGFFEAKGDAAIATGWSTAYIVDRAPGFAGKFYFVQDHEPEFYPTGTENLLARATYDLDLDCICASPWLDRIMSEEYGRWARHFYLAYNHDLYRIFDQAKHKARFASELDGPCKIAVYARDHTARRCVYLALMAFQLLGEKRQDFEVHFFGQDDLPFLETNFPAKNHGILNAEQLAALYNECHIGICFSATNYSLVPQEMMACGLPLLEIDGDSTRSIFGEGTVTLGGPDPVDIATKLERLIDKPRVRQRQAKAALEWVSGFSWHGAAEAVESAIKERMAERCTLAAPAKTKTHKIELDVVIPTYNGMGELEPVIDALRQQRNFEAIQIHCIDSSSSDGTTEWLKKQPDISTTVIDQKTFQHGRTRNEGAALGKAPIIAFLTQDAMPINSGWGPDIIKMFNHVPEAAGLIGRHEPYPDHPEYVREEITRHFANMLKYPLVLSKDTDPKRWDSGDLGWRQFLHFYSDNNSAMRRSVWKDIPYPEVDYGEDQVWARDIIDAGYSKLYAPSACVYHSHDYDPAETYKRAKTEGAFFYRYFGYELGNGSEEQIAKRVKGEQIHFKAWAKKRNTPPDEVEMRLQNIVEKHRGWRDGLLEAMGELK